MALVDRHPMVRWIAPAAMLTVIGGVVLAPRAMAEPTLPARTAEQLLVDLQQQRTTAFSGTVQTSADLGLPLPTGSNGPLALLNGTHTIRVWQEGPQKSRVSLLNNAAEVTMIRNGDQVWQYASREKSATRLTIPQPGTGDRKPGALNGQPPSTPQQAAEQALTAIDPNTEVTVGRAARVAGRSAYELVLTPRSQQTLVNRVSIAIDADTSAPLRVEVWPNGAKAPAIQVGFTQISYATPAAEVFTFTPAPGVEVTQKSVDGPATSEPKSRNPSGQPESEPRVIGTGWETVTIVTLPQGTLGQPQEKPTTELAAEQQQAIDQLPRVSGSWGGGRLVKTALVTAVITDDGRIAAGAVPAERITAALAG